ncbi:MAG: CpsB/CapC family capsule biosynthesis tyrosine phosphatase [Flavobacterium nitrogenifigens]|uniref:protein-tyrosine-phosphatase n=1 Tax=Flavobacterium nitrogenifigens TaxID=1617283 RepID=A0A521DJ79_9FLAO|nr:CpsB/CapC family capsule biosynthesis tyrosine phosphatase [Flavobacterium nitrogenifigens]KAF2330052.1 histidinol phosphatase [Flavobacterium nitrogenifigens]MDQ8012229.1 CpsB/CapC family capsule biosynthesis tyrosine phosphatase [Flavobacterium nitrogenifigens]SMO71804.1 Tyrosine-protein phosphatase YwqE [Flavobacterium nitrogenifigens]
MFLFFKPKPVLKDLLADSFVDIHSHILPGIDDGAKNIQQTSDLIKSLEGFGVSQFVTTPHISHYIWDNSPQTILNTYAETKSLLERDNINPPFKAAAEYFMDDWFEKHLKAEKLLTLKDNYVLVEMSYMNAPLELYKILFDLQVAGYIPVLAHPERYIFYHKKFNEYEKLKRAGCKFQLNLLSIVGYYGGEITKITEELLKKGMYDFAGTDVHHAKHIKAFDEKVNSKNISNLKEVIANNTFFKF